MPRSAKVDREATALARHASRSGMGYVSPADSEFYSQSQRRSPVFLTDHRSFVTTTGHLRLYGRDMGVLRRQVYDETPRCCVCGVAAKLDAHPVDPLRAELAHKLARGRGGCDCRHNVEIKCRRHHRGPEGEHA
jgi:hypothetical protein